MFKKGQKVWDVIFGPGEVSEILTNGASVPVVVRFDDAQVVYFALDGKHLAYAMQTLFPYPIEITKAVTKPSIDWSHVSSEFNYLVQDSDGEGYLCGEEPACVESGWGSESHYVSAGAFTSYEPGTCDWRDSLVKRPELVQEI